MSVKNPTIAERIAAVTAVVPAITVDQARKMIRDNNIRSLTKASLVAVDYAGKDAEELAKVFGEVAEVPKETEKLAYTVDHSASNNGITAMLAKEDKEPSLSVNDPSLAEQPEAKKNAETYPPAAKKIAAKGPTPRKTAVVVTPGPRGFRFGDVWNNSVKSGTGVAILPANRYKLLKHAESLGIHADNETDVKVLAKQIAVAMVFAAQTPAAEPTGETPAA